jgi:hypothetical protein
MLAQITLHQYHVSHQIRNKLVDGYQPTQRLIKQMLYAKSLEHALMPLEQLMIFANSMVQLVSLTEHPALSKPIVLHIPNTLVIIILELMELASGKLLPPLLPQPHAELNNVVM